MKNYSNNDIDRLLRGKRHKGEEDLLIMQSDGSRACAGWELTKGFHLTDLKEKKELSDKELLDSAYRNLERRKKYQK